MNRFLIGLLVALLAARFYDIHVRQPDASVPELITMLAPLEIWLGAIIMWSAIALLRRYL